MTKNHKEMDLIKEALKAVGRRKPLYVIMLVGAVIAVAAANVMPSLILKSIVDEAILSSQSSLWHLALFYLLAVLVIGLLDFIREFSAAVIGQNMILDMRRQMLKKLSDLPMQYYLKTPIGDTVSRFTADLDAVSTLFSAGLVSAFADLFKIIGLFLALVVVSKPLAGVALAALPILFMLTRFFKKRIFEKQKNVRQRVSDINTSIQEMYSGIKVIKLFGKELFFSNRFEQRLEAHRLAMNGNSIYDAWFPCIMQIVRALVITTALFIGAQHNGTAFSLGLSLGTLAAAVDLYIRMFEPIEAIAAEIQTIQQAFAGIERIKAFYSQPNHYRKDAAHKPVNTIGDTYTISIKDVSFAYESDKNVLKAVSMTIKSGTKVAIAGRTGAGKSTIMSLIAGLYPVDKGTISIGGMDPYAISAHERRRYIGIVPQTIHLFNGSIYDNITLRDDFITKEQVWHAVETVGLSDEINNLKLGIDTLVGEGEYQMSFGQMQLISLARAIVTDPPVLLLDEMTSGLDALTEKNVLSAIKRVSKNRTIITISHRLSGIIDADEVFILDNGRVAESGKPDELTEKQSWFAVFKKLEALNWKIQ